MVSPKTIFNILKVVVILLLFVGILYLIGNFGLSAYRSSPIYQAQSDQELEKTVDTFVEIISGQNEDLSKRDEEDLEKIGSGSNFIFFEDLRLKKAAEVFKQIHQKKPLDQQWEFDEKSKKNASVSLYFRNPDDASDSSTGKIYLSLKEERFSLSPKWEIYKIEAPDELEPCVKYLIEKDGLLSCLTDQYKKFLNQPGSLASTLWNWLKLFFGDIRLPFFN